MKKFHLSLPILTLTLCLGSCEHELVLEPRQAAPTILQSRSSQELPFHGVYQNTSVTLLAPPPMLQQEIVSIGRATHLGQSTFSVVSTVDMTTPPPFSLGGTGVFVAANGDELYVSLSGTATPDGQGNNALIILFTVTGGSGRFENASGNLTTYTVVQPGVPGGEISIEGTISY